MKTFGLILILVILLGGWYWYSQHQNPAPVPSSVDTSTNAGNASSDHTQTGGTSSGSVSSGTTATPGNPVSDGSGHMLYTVTYNNSVFTPAVLTINHGDAVKWVNKDNLTMRVSAIPQSTNPTPITDPNTESKGKTYTLTFTQIGTWSIKNLNDTAVGPGASTIYVK